MEVQENNAVFVVILWQDPIEYNGRYAILVAPVRNSDEKEFKDNIVNMRDVLIKNLAWNSKNIIVLTIGTESFIDGDATRNNVLTAFSAIEYGNWHFNRDFGSGSGPNDLVLIEFRDHGGSLGSPSYVTDFSTYSESNKGFNYYDYFWDYETNVEITKITASRFALVADFCYSGGFVDHCSASNARVVSSQTRDWQSYRVAYQLYRRFVPDADGCIGIDSNGNLIRGAKDNYVTLEEAHYYAAAYCWATFSNQNPPQHPQINSDISLVTGL